MTMPLDLAGKNVCIADVVSKASQHGAVAEGGGPHATRLGEIDRHVGSDAHAAAVADEHDLPVIVMGSMAEIADLHEGSVQRHAAAAAGGAFGFTRHLEQGVEIRTKPVAHLLLLFQ